MEGNCMEILPYLYKENLPSLTAIVLTYNHVGTIETCLRSVLEQRHEGFKLKILVLDDFSTDGTSTICRDFKKAFPKIELVIPSENTKGKLFQKAIENLDSDYFCFIDGDDQYLNKNLFSEAIQFLENNRKYSLYAQDTLFKTPTKSYSYTLEILPFYGKKESGDISLEEYCALHPCSRVLRRMFNYQIEWKDILLSDLPLLVFNLSKAPGYLELGRYGGLYNWNGKGYFSSLTEPQRSFYKYLSWLYVLRKLGFRHDKQIKKIMCQEGIISKRFEKIFNLFDVFPKFAFIILIPLFYLRSIKTFFANICDSFAQNLIILRRDYTKFEASRKRFR